MKKRSGEYAPFSVLKAVIAIQKIGKKNAIPISQPKTPNTSLLIRLFSISSSLAEVFREHPDQENRDNVCQDDRQDAACRGNPRVKLLQPERIHQVSECCGRAARSTGGGRVDFGKNRKQKYRLNHDDNSDRPV